MKKNFFLITALLSILGMQAKQPDRLTFATTLGTGIALNTPSRTPFAWQVAGHYTISDRFSAGIGTGVSFYEKILIPLFADVKFTIVKPRRITPYLECGAGYSFAPARSANGGIFLNPSFGVQYSVCKDKKITLALGYELQKLERVKKQEQALFTAEFTEKLSHRFLTIKVGFIF